MISFKYSEALDGLFSKTFSLSYKHMRILWDLIDTYCLKSLWNLFYSLKSPNILWTYLHIQKIVFIHYFKDDSTHILTFTEQLSTF